MKAMIFESAYKAVFRDVPTPGPDGKLLIRVKSAGICGSDLSIYAGRHPRAKFPLIAGHEFTGIVETSGKGLSTKFKPGDRIVVNPLYSCGTCRACLSGAFHVCDHLKLIGIDCNGGFAQYAVVPQENAFLLPVSLADPYAALAEPAAVILHAMRMLKPLFYGTALITGSGPMGLLTALMLRDAGVKTVIVSEINAARLKNVADLGFEIINSKEEPLYEAVAKRTKGAGADIVVDASGSSAVSPHLASVTAVRGTILILSVFKEPALLDLREVNFKELTILGTRVYTRLDFVDAIDYTANHSDTISRIVSHTAPLAQGPEMMASVYSGTRDAVKVLFNCD